MRYLGIDYGTKRIGVAIADVAVNVAMPRGVIGADKSAIREIAVLCRRESVKIIVIGLPLTLRGEEGEMAQRARAFGQELRKNLAIPIEFIDERLSTKVSSPEGMGSADAAAAAAILQTWLDRKRSGNDFKSHKGRRDP